MVVDEKGPQPARFFLESLAFSGPRVPVARLDFVPTVNVVYGASNAGKSFIVKALDFMTGAGTSPPAIDEMQGYDRTWLRLKLPNSGQVTLTRAVKGGEFGLFDRAVEPSTKENAVRTLLAEHKASGESVSSFLLSELGIADKRVANTQAGAKNTFTFRHVAPYVFVEETNMMAEWSPTRISERSNDTFNKNVLKFLLTGVDDSAMVTTKGPDAQKNAHAGKVEIVDEFIASAEQELARRFPNHADLAIREERISSAIEGLQAKLAEYQENLDTLRVDRRKLVDALAEANERAGETAIMLDRFATLRQVYDSDVSRLSSLEEGGAALLAGARRSCPVCGADPEHQRHAHGFDEIATTQASVRAEIAKINLERSELTKATHSLQAERDGLKGRGIRLAERIEQVEADIEKAKPEEASARKGYEDLDEVRDEVRQGLELVGRIGALKARRAQLDRFKASRPKRGSVQTGIDGIVGHKLAMHVQSVLEAWQFPRLQTVSFDEGSHDIRINGKERRANGKGVRALMHTAFKIGAFLFCRENGLPHPGVLVLDSPLLSFRDSIKSKHGALSDDEKEIVNTGLNEHFYRYLLAKGAIAQFVVIENYAPPIDLGPSSRIIEFVGADGDGERKGFF